MLFALLLALAAPADWTPARWNWTDPATLDLLQGTPVNCLRLRWDPADAQALSAFADRRIATLAVLKPKSDPVETARAAVRARMIGVVLEGDFPEAQPTNCGTRWAISNQSSSN